MAFCKFSSECTLNNSTYVDNIFINQFLPTAPDVCVKVYIYGLYKCANPNSYDNTIECFSSELGLTPQDIEDAFLYWQDLGVVDVILGTSFQVRYNSLKNVLNGTKKFSKTKYSEFNKHAQELIEGRMITSNEYVEYYTIMEVFKVEPKAMLVIIDYCTQIKGKNVGYAYINTVARNWASEGITTYEAVIEKIKSYDVSIGEINKILKVCKFKRQPNVDEQDKFIKWTKDFGFEINTILYVANNLIEKNIKINFNKLDLKLTKYYESKKITIEEIVAFEENKSLMFDLAKNVCKSIGVYYENLEIVVEHYISKWLEFGHTENSLITLANYCFKTSIRTLDGLDKIILKLYKLGIVDENAIEQYLLSILKQDNEIKNILKKCGINRKVNSQDREFYKTWKFSWNINNELLDFAISKSKNKNMPMQYLNKILSKWHTENITTIRQAEKCITENTSTQKSTKFNKGREYKKEDLDALFDSLEEIDI